MRTEIVDVGSLINFRFAGLSRGTDVPIFYFLGRVSLRYNLIGLSAKITRSKLFPIYRSYALMRYLDGLHMANDRRIHWIS